MAAGNSIRTARVPGRPFKKGVSGNPNGRPKGAADFAAMVRAHAFKRVKGTRTQLHALIDRLYVDDPKTYLAYGFGKPIETHEVTAEVSHSCSPQLLEAAREIAKKL